MDACEKVSHIEFVYGKAKLAIAQKAVQATLSEGRDVNLMRARHPLIPANTVRTYRYSLGYGLSNFIDYWLQHGW